MLEIEDYAFPFGLCFSRPIMLKIMLAYCINATLTLCCRASQISTDSRRWVKKTLWGHFSTDFQNNGTDGKVFSSPKRRYLICENPPWTRAVAFVRSSPTQGKTLAVAVDPRPRSSVAQRAAIFCCYGYQDRLALNGRSYEEGEAYRLE